MITRLNVSMPSEVVSKVKKFTSKRGVSRFLTEAANEKIEKLEREKALEELLAAPPSFKFLKGKNASARWVRELRRTDNKRLKRIWGKRV
ncbi:hypothetical protein HYU92_05375 [Candidatus Curtissbacteria bacterium]|nr:hypothetical protein [Candidatus Curtissbacteria bacterium]